VCSAESQAQAGQEAGAAVGSVQPYDLQQSPGQNPAGAHGKAAPDRDTAQLLGGQAHMRHAAQDGDGCRRRAVLPHDCLHLRRSPGA